jgi:hypothetical protein
MRKRVPNMRSNLVLKISVFPTDYYNFSAVKFPLENIPLSFHFTKWSLQMSILLHNYIAEQKLLHKQRARKSYDLPAEKSFLS